MSRISISKVRSTFADTLNRVSYGKERVILRRRSKDIAALVPIEDLLLIEEIKDRIDIEDARKALEEYERTGESITIEKLKDELGL